MHMKRLGTLVNDCTVFVYFFRVVPSFKCNVEGEKTNQLISINIYKVWVFFFLV